MIRQPDPLARLQYLQGCSAVSRGDLLLKLFDEEQKLAQEITALINQRVETLALMLVAQWQRERRLNSVEGSHEHETQRDGDHTRKPPLRPSD